MNKHVLNQIISILDSFSTEDLNLFRKSFTKDSYYSDLLEIITKQDKSIKIEDRIFAIDHSAKDKDWDFDSVKDNLRNKLLDFVLQSDKDLQNEATLHKNIETVDALISRKLFAVAYDLMGKNYKALKKLENKKRFSYLFIQHLNQIYRLKMLRGYDTESMQLPDEFNAEEISWMNSFAEAAITSFHYREKQENETEEDFSNNLLFNLILEHKRNRFEYDAAYRHLQNSHIPFYTNESEKKGYARNILGIRNTFKLLECAIALNKPETVHEALELIEKQSQWLREINFRLFAYLVLVVSDLRIHLSLQTLKLDKKLFESQTILFAYKEIQHVPERLEVNRGIYLLLRGKYADAEKQFKGIYLKKSTEDKELTYYLDLFRLFAHLCNTAEFNMSEYEPNYDLITTKKAPTPFIRDLVKRMRPPNEAETQYTRTILFQNVSEFIQKHPMEQLNIFERVFITVLKHSENALDEEL